MLLLGQRMLARGTQTRSTPCLRQHHTLRLPAFVKLIARLRKTEIWPAELEPLVTWYQPLMQELYEDAETRAADIAQLQQIAAGYHSRERFLTELTLDPPEATSGEARAIELDEEHVTIATIHWAKGGEWKIVRVLNVVEGCITVG